VRSNAACCAGFVSPATHPPGLPGDTKPEQQEAMERTRQRFAFLVPEVQDRMRAMHAALS
jgi:hypothetical protein